MTDTRITDFEAVAPMPIYTQADLDAAVQKEREACAQQCETVAASWSFHMVAPSAAMNCAAAIRARGSND